MIALSGNSVDRTSGTVLGHVGGAIGQGIPVAVGAAVATPERAGRRPAGRRQRPVHVDWVSLAGGLGVPARQVGTAEELAAGLEWALTESGPHLLQATL
jgi:thiamine pyrophosphate-dependent acetolactate synthase large subunit-like protein